jgi:hypothetical protein
MSNGTNIIPLTSAVCGGRVVCRCCLGKGSGGPELEKELGTRHVVYEHLFRAAISPFSNISPDKMLQGIVAEASRTRGLGVNV